MLYPGRKTEDCQNRSNLSPCSGFASPFQSRALCVRFTAWPETSTKRRFPLICVTFIKTKKVLFSCGEGEKRAWEENFQDRDLLTRYSDFFQNCCTLLGTITEVTGMAVRRKTSQPACNSTVMLLRTSCELLLPSSGSSAERAALIYRARARGTGSAGCGYTRGC